MYDQLKEIDTEKHEIIAKWKLFQESGDNIPLSRQAFDYAYWYGRKLGYWVTASIFDRKSLNFLLSYDIPFIKIANNTDLHYLIKYIPDTMMLYISSNVPLILDRRKKAYHQMWCISEYPANEKDYLKMKLKPGCVISDHTTTFNLFKKLVPSVVEWHYKLEDSTGLDAGVIARTPEQLKEVL
jgi:sialic acid synthase SpsE